jgi:hypothetical protein
VLSHERRFGALPHGKAAHVRLLLAVVLVVCVVLFFTGIVSPRRSERLQRRFGGLMLRGEHKGEKKAGKVGDATAKSFEVSRRMANASARAGRKVRRSIKD